MSILTSAFSSQVSLAQSDVSVDHVQGVDVALFSGKLFSEYDERVAFQTETESFTTLLTDITAELGDFEYELPSDSRLYKGLIEGIEDSWVRLLQSGDGTWSGAIYNGNSLFFMDKTDAIESLLTESVNVSLKALAQPMFFIKQRMSVLQRVAMPFMMKPQTTTIL